MRNKIIDFEEFFAFADGQKKYDAMDIWDFQEYYQNLNSLEENLKDFKTFLKEKSK